MSLLSGATARKRKKSSSEITSHEVVVLEQFVFVPLLGQFKGSGSY